MERHKSLYTSLYMLRNYTWIFLVWGIQWKVPHEVVNLLLNIIRFTIAVAMLMPNRTNFMFRHLSSHKLTSLWRLPEYQLKPHFGQPNPSLFLPFFPPSFFIFYYLFKILDTGMSRGLFWRGIKKKVNKKWNFNRNQLPQILWLGEAHKGCNVPQLPDLYHVWHSTYCYYW